MGSVRKTIAAAAGSFALLASSTLASAAPQAKAQPVPALNSDAWLMLSTLSGTQSLAFAGANSSAQRADVPPPPSPIAAEAMADGAGEIIPFVLMYGLIVLALTIHGSSERPNSPA